MTFSSSHFISFGSFIIIILFYCRFAWCSDEIECDSTFQCSLKCMDVCNKINEENKELKANFRVLELKFQEQDKIINQLTQEKGKELGLLENLNMTFTAYKIEMENSLENQRIEIENSIDTAIYNVKRTIYLHSVSDLKTHHQFDLPYFDPGILIIHIFAGGMTKSNVQIRYHTAEWPEGSAIGDDYIPVVLSHQPDGGTSAFQSFGCTFNYDTRIFKCTLITSSSAHWVKVGFYPLNL